MRICCCSDSRQLRSRALDTELVGLAVWDRSPGDGPGGTAETVKSWRQRGLKVVEISPRDYLAPEVADATSNDSHGPGLRWFRAHEAAELPEFYSPMSSASALFQISRLCASTMNSWALSAACSH